MGYYIIVFELIIGFLAGMKAKDKNRNPYLWFFIGFIFSLIGLLAIFILPSCKADKRRMIDDEE